jgi:hydrogenase small subunit
MGLEKGGLFNTPLSRKEFIQACAMAATVMGLPHSKVMEVVEAAENKDTRPPVIWLHLQECTGDSESLLRSNHPTVGKLILELVSLDYHETLMTAAGHQAEKSLHDSMNANKGKYVLVVEGSIPTKDPNYCKVAGKNALTLLKEAAENAYAIIAIGNCATYGGPQSAGPNPTGAVGVSSIIKNKPIINLPGCPVNPYNFLATVLYVVTWGKLPQLDKKGRPMFAYGKLIHEHCERRGHFDAGRFVINYGDEGHQKGWCLFQMGCKGPVTYANCSTVRFNDAEVWPIGTGSPCAGCTEQGVAFFTSLKEKCVPYSYPAAERTDQDRGNAGAVAAGLGGAAIGVAAGVAATLSSKVSDKEESE